MSPEMVIILVLAIVAVAAVAWVILEKQRSNKLRSKFGPEYDRLVREEGSRRKAEAQLDRMQKRVERFRIQELAPEHRAGFAESWRQVQARFVDEPRLAVERADTLVGEVMDVRGYPVADFEQRSADISVDHPHVVEHYRAAHEIALRDRREGVSTEELRKAMVHYRELFEDLLGSRIMPKEEVRR